MHYAWKIKKLLANNNCWEEIENNNKLWVLLGEFLFRTSTFLPFPPTLLRCRTTFNALWPFVWIRWRRNYV